MRCCWPLTLRLPWKYQFEFAGFIVAQEKGFYRQAGLDVELLEYDPKVNSVERLLSGEEEYGLYNSMFLIEDRRLLPAVLIGSYLKRSPLVLVTKPGIRHPKDLAGKRIMGTLEELNDSALGIMLRHYNLLDKVHLLPPSFRNREFSEGYVDAMTAFTSNELFDLVRQGVPHQVIDPFDYGFYSTAVNLFASEHEVYNQPARAQRFLAASALGWDYALRHQKETVDLIYHRYSRQKSKEALAWEAGVIQKLMMLEAYPIGTLDVNLAKRMLELQTQAGLLEPGAELNYKSYSNLATLAANSPQRFTAEETAYLHRKQTLVLCVPPEWIWFNSTFLAEHYGYASETLSVLEEFTGIKAKLLKTRNWAENLQALEAQECDLIPLLPPDPELGKRFLFSGPIMNVGYLAVTKSILPGKSLADLYHQKVGVHKDTPLARMLMHKYPLLEIVEVEQNADGLRQVADGALASFILLDHPDAHQWISEYEGELKAAFRLPESTSMSLASSKKDPLLAQILAKFAHKLQNKVMEDLLGRWQRTHQDMRTRFSVAWKLILVASLLVTALLWERKRLQRYNLRLQSMTKRLDELNMTKDKAISVIGHDLRGTMNSLNMIFNRVIHSPKDFDQEILDGVRKTTHQANLVLENLLVWARNQQGEIPFVPQPLPLDQQFRQTLNLFGVAALHRGVQLTLEGDQGLIVQADAIMLDAIVRNLVANAVKASLPGGTVRLVAQRGETRHRIRVEDEGRGLDQAMLDQLLTTNPHTQMPGRGLGLSLCVEFVARHGGRLVGTSEPGKGTVMEFELPVGG